MHTCMSSVLNRRPRGVFGMRRLRHLIRVPDASLAFASPKQSGRAAGAKAEPARGDVQHCIPAKTGRKLPLVCPGQTEGLSVPLLPRRHRLPGPFTPDTEAEWTTGAVPSSKRSEFRPE
ncbi:hypothetical protein ISCGN_005067 [Ixodes scapularis]